MEQNRVREKSAANGKSAELPEYLKTLLEGSGVGIRENLPYPFVKPEWLDVEKSNRGRKFAMDHAYGLLFSTGMSVVLTYAYQIALQPIIFTANSSNPFTAFKRLLKTISYILSWYEHDILQPGSIGHKNMKTVRGLHERVKQRMTTEPADEVKSKLTNEGKPMWTEFHEELLEDYQACPDLKIPIQGENQVFVSQADMAIVQFAFMGLISCFPRLFGIHNATEDDLDDYLHHWRLIGHLLGIEDKYNLCAGDFKTVRQRARDILDLWLAPSLRTVTRDWLHMSRCMIEGVAGFAPGTDFQVHMLYLSTKVLRIPGTRLRATLSYTQMFLYYYFVFFFKYLIRIPFVFAFFNSLAIKGIAEAVNKPASELKKLEAVVYAYETQFSGSSCPMMS